MIEETIKLNDKYTVAKAFYIQIFQMMAAVLPHRESGFQYTVNSLLVRNTGMSLTVVNAKWLVVALRTWLCMNCCLCIFPEELKRTRSCIN